MIKYQLAFRFLLPNHPVPEIKIRFLSGPSHVLAHSLTKSVADITKCFVEQLENVWPTQQRVEEHGHLSGRQNRT